MHMHTFPLFQVIQHIPNNLSPREQDTIDLDDAVQVHSQNTAENHCCTDDSAKETIRHANSDIPAIPSRKLAWGTPQKTDKEVQNGMHQDVILQDRLESLDGSYINKPRTKPRPLFNIQENNIPNTPDTSYSVTSNVDDYDYCNYTPKFANKYNITRTPTYDKETENMQPWSESDSEVINNTYDYTEDVQKFDEEEENDPDVTNKRVSSDMSLTEEDLQSLFEAADALDSGLHSHFHSARESCSNVRKPRYSLSQIMPTELPATPESAFTVAEDYDYNNYVPKFAMRYRTPVKSIGSSSEIYSISESPNVKPDHSYYDSPRFEPEIEAIHTPSKKRVSYIQAMQHEEEEEADGNTSVFSSPCSLPALKTMKRVARDSVSVSGSSIG